MQNHVDAYIQDVARGYYGSGRVIRTIIADLSPEQITNINEKIEAERLQLEDQVRRNMPGIAGIIVILLMSVIIFDIYESDDWPRTLKIWVYKIAIYGVLFNIVYLGSTIGITS